MTQLVQWVASARHFVIVTGAGISTSAGIPDFRGPQGVWTLEKQKKEKKINENNDTEQKQSNNASTNTTTVTITNGRKRPRPSNTATPFSACVDDSNTSSLPPPATTTTALDFSKAQPTLTHRAIATLAHAGRLKFCITQNVDGLHRRSGLLRSQHAVLHGCAFTEKCSKCGTEFFRDEEVGGMSFQKTGRTCTAATATTTISSSIGSSSKMVTCTTGELGAVVCCTGDLHDTLLDWEDELPRDDLDRSERACQRADLVLCLGTSLRIEPAGSLPTLAQRYVIVNLQDTPKDKKAALIIRAKVDDVMKELMQRLGYSDASWDDTLNVPPPIIERQWKAATTIVVVPKEEEAVES
jgi:NAD+-dependent protein deacetylase sirtuin 6